MDPSIRNSIETALAGVTNPYLGVDLVSAGAIRSIERSERGLEIGVRLGFPAKRYQSELATALRDALAPHENDVYVNVDWEITSHAVQRNLKPLGDVRNVIAVASAKGGVGKSTTAVNMALALAGEGAAVGLLDADIYGPSQPRMLGLRGRTPETRDGKSLEPLEAHGIACMSIGFLIEEEQPMVWRGPMVTQALRQLYGDTRWGALDYLIVDMPPGTGDIQLTLSQQVPVSGAVIVTTPQDIALLDAQKGLKMFEKVEISVLGVVENMSTHICSNCGHEEAIFGSGGGRAMAGQFGVPFLGDIPLDIRVRKEADEGRPSVVAEPEGEIARRYFEVARAAAARLSLISKDYSRKFPNIVVEQT